MNSGSSIFAQLHGPILTRAEMNQQRDAGAATIDMLLAKNRAGDRKVWLTEEGNKAEVLE